ncbi:MAG: DUF6194 family protein [Alphaproteobacteria bacterium]|nr:DUF6194 family protein [Alphaproteobacteria bacterium]
MFEEKDEREKLSVDEIAGYLTKICPGLVFSHNWGERGLFYNPENKLPKGIYLMTFKEKDGENDKASQIDRGNIFRLNLGLTKTSYEALFGPRPARPKAGGVVDVDYDFTRIDQLMPHPVYGWMGWVCILNPSVANLKKLEPLIMESYENAKVKFAKKIG